MASEIFFEDLEIGRSEVFGDIMVTREEVLDFARQFDPQPFHLDDEAASRSLFGGLCASGWHTAAIMMRLLVDHRIGRTAGLGSPGFDDLRWHRPVYPGDTLHVRSTCMEKTPSRSDPTMGSVRHFVEVFDEDEHRVLSVTTIELVARRKDR